MHELSIVQSLLEIVEAQAARHNFGRVNSLKVSFGRISALDPRALEFAFSVQSRGTVSEGALLEMEIKPLIVSCSCCKKDTELEAYEPVCPLCGAWGMEIIAGNEGLSLLELDVD